MISVTISINGTPVMARSAVNVGEGYKPGTCQYEVDDARVITHNPDDGAVALAIEMLRGIREVKGARGPVANLTDIAPVGLFQRWSQENERRRSEYDTANTPNKRKGPTCPQ